VYDGNPVDLLRGAVVRPEGAILVGSDGVALQWAGDDVNHLPAANVRLGDFRMFVNQSLAVARGDRVGINDGAVQSFRPIDRDLFNFAPNLADVSTGSVLFAQSLTQQPVHLSDVDGSHSPITAYPVERVDEVVMLQTLGGGTRTLFTLGTTLSRRTVETEPLSFLPPEEITEVSFSRVVTRTLVTNGPVVELWMLREATDTALEIERCELTAVSTDCAVIGGFDPGRFLLSSSTRLVADVAIGITRIALLTDVDVRVITRDSELGELLVSDAITLLLPITPVTSLPQSPASAAVSARCAWITDPISKQFVTIDLTTRQVVSATTTTTPWFDLSLDPNLEDDLTALGASGRIFRGAVPAEGCAVTLTNPAVQSAEADLLSVVELEGALFASDANGRVWQLGEP
jgi:hypothetical protein